MKVSYNWLNDFIDLSGILIPELSELLSTRVAEVETFYEVGRPLKGAIAGKIISTTPLNEKRLVAEVDFGNQRKQVVCSVSAVKPKDGMLVAYIPVGENFFDGKQLSIATDREFSGVKSSGLLASARDLELFDEHSCLYELYDIKPGERLDSYLGGVDSVIEIDNKSLTHRPDLWSHFGFAQELSAVLRRPLKKNLGLYADDCLEGKKAFARLTGGQPKVIVKIDEATKVQRLMAVQIDGVVDSVSPDWMKRRLYAIGAGVKSFLIDLSNYVMYDCGQPNHLFDRRAVLGDIIHIRSARDGETIQMLDGTLLNLTKDDAIIADSKRPLDLGGVMGGHDTSVTPTTTSVIYTGGIWDPVLVRKASVRHQVRTDASQRYEKGLSPHLATVGLQRLLELLPLGCPEAKVVGGVSDCFLIRPVAVQITLTARLLAERLGTGAPSFEEGCQILKNLRLKFVSETSDSCTVEVPYDRATKDLSIPEDLIEEIGRIWGYENISEVAPRIATSPSNLTPLREMEIKLKEILRGEGLNEISNNSFIRPEYSEQLGYPLDEGVFIENPIDDTQGALRTSLIPGMLDKVVENAKFQSAIQIFEVGRGYFRSPIGKFKQYKTLDRFKNNAAYEKRLLGLGVLIAQDQIQLSYPRVTGGAEFYSLLDLVRRLCLSVCARELEVKPVEKMLLSWMHPHRAAELYLDDTAIGVLAECTPRLTKDVSGRVVLCELELDTLLEQEQSRKYKPISKFPNSLFEISIVAPVKESFSSILKVIHKGIDGSYVRGIELLDVYQGAPLPDDKKSISIRLTFGTDEKTLSGEELSKLQEKLMAYIEQNHFGIRR